MPCEILIILTYLMTAAASSLPPLLISSTSAQIAPSGSRLRNFIVKFRRAGTIIVILNSY